MVSDLILFSISRTVKEFRRVFRECKANKTSILSFTHDSRGVNLSGLAILVIVFCIVYCSCQIFATMDIVIYFQFHHVSSCYLRSVRMAF